MSDSDYPTVPVEEPPPVAPAKAKRKYERKVARRYGPRKQVLEAITADPLPPGVKRVVVEDEHGIKRVAEVRVFENEDGSKRIEQVRQERRRRDDVNDDGTRRRLVVNHALLDHETYHYHWINDAPGRIQALTVKDDWDIIRDPAVKDDGNAEGSQVRALVGSHPDGKPLFAYLARKRKDWWLADRKKLLKQVDKFDEEMQRGITQDPNALKATDPHAYVPDGFDKAVKVTVSGDQPRRMQSYEP